jgi:DNA (cytosine-5)-methyltransferase 1
MSKPRLLDLFCGAGGAAMGYHRAGFEVVGVDIAFQKHYPFEFHQADALEYVAEHGHEFDAIHASPPCQAYSRLRHLPWLKDREYWDSLPPTLAALRAQSLPWVVENVEDAPLPGAIVLCGVMFNLSVYRHRKFLSPEFLFQPDHHKHQHTIAAGHASMAKRYAESHVAGFREASRASVAGHATGARKTGELMGIDWMTRDELAQAIPPAYSEWIGSQLIAALTPMP